MPKNAVLEIGAFRSIPSQPINVLLRLSFCFYFSGTSAPEFFTNIMGTFVTKSDLGIGTIVGRSEIVLIFVFWKFPRIGAD